jgi:integrase/recombinase XerD
MTGEVFPVALAPHGQQVVPAMIRDSGPAAAFAWDEFFAAALRNPHTRAAYTRAAVRFLRWLEPQAVELARVTPGMVAAYFDRMDASVPTKKQHLAAIRGLFDQLVLRHVVVLNPAASVRGERYAVVEGKTPEITPAQVRALLAAIPADTPAGLRDRAVVCTLVYTAARAGAVARLKVRHLTHDGTQSTLRFDEKGGLSREIPVRHDLERFLREYLALLGPAPARDAPLFQSVGPDGRLTGRPLTGVDVCRMVKRRAAAAGLPARLSPHSFRVATITDLLSQGVPLEDVQHLAGHADPRTTRLYDRRSRRVTRNIVERISI